MKIMNFSFIKEIVEKIKIETLKKIWIDEFVSLSCKAYSFKCIDKNTNNLKGKPKSQSKKNSFVEFYKCLFGGEYQKKCDKYIIRSLNHEMYLQQVKRIRTFLLDGKPCYEDTYKSKPW